MFVLQKVRFYLLAAPRAVKRIVVMLLDTALLALSVWLAYFLRVGEFLSLTRQTAEHLPISAVIVGLVVSTPLMFVFGVYRQVFRFSGFTSMIAVIKALAVYTVIFSTIVTIIGISGVPRTIGLIQPVVFFLLISVTRFIAGYWLGGQYRFTTSDNKRRRVLVYGAGAAGRELAKLLSASVDTAVVGFIDDDGSLQGRHILGLPVFSPTDVDDANRTFAATEIMFAIPSANKRRRKEIIQNLRSIGLPVRTLPTYADLVNGRVSIDDIRELSVDEILGRSAVEPDRELMAADVTGKVVLVTGAGGSIGSELCRQIMMYHPEYLIMFEQSEFALYTIQTELQELRTRRGQDETINLIPMLGSTLDMQFIENVFSSHKIDTVYHAAAYKHVSLVEDNPSAGLINNLTGTTNVAEVACRVGVKKFVLVSTDKAVRPTSVMGVSKRLAENALQIQSQNVRTTIFAIVRFGNVIDSSGSVVPLFRQQIRSGGPVTLTDPEVTRYFMTISEAAQLVIQAGALTRAVEDDNASAPVYLLEMGKPVKILDLAKRMIQLSGFSVYDEAENPDGDIEIKVIGLRQGEKLFEELLIDGTSGKTSHPKIHVAAETAMGAKAFDKYLKEIQRCIDDADQKRLRVTLQKEFPAIQGV